MDKMNKMKKNIFQCPYFKKLVWGKKIPHASTNVRNRCASTHVLKKNRRIIEKKIIDHRSSLLCSGNLKPNENYQI